MTALSTEASETASFTESGLGSISVPGLERMRTASVIPAFPWHVKFHEGIDFGGDNFTLGVVQQTNPIALLNPLVLGTCDWDKDLTGRRGPTQWKNWNDCISSVESVSYSKAWVLCEHIGFGGDKLFGTGDARNLVERGWNDRTSSIIMSSTSVAVVKAAIEILVS